MTREPLDDSMLTPNAILRHEIDGWKIEHDIEEETEAFEERETEHGRLDDDDYLDEDDDDLDEMILVMFARAVDAIARIEETRRHDDVRESPRKERISGIF